MSNVGRVLTLVIEIQESEYPKWIMDSHLKGPQYGIKVKKVAEGDQLRKLQKIEEAGANVNFEDLERLNDALAD
jgi:hypothetical protein